MIGCLVNLLTSYWGITNADLIKKLGIAAVIFAVDFRVSPHILCKPLSLNGSSPSLRPPYLGPRVVEATLRSVTAAIPKKVYFEAVQVYLGILLYMNTF